MAEEVMDRDLVRERLSGAIHEMEATGDSVLASIVRWYINDDSLKLAFEVVKLYRPDCQYLKDLQAYFDEEE